MEPLKPTYLRTGRATLMATACLIAPLVAGETLGTGGLAERERARRTVAVDEARELLKMGDEAYRAARYKEAVEAYAGARDLIPNAPLSAELRAAAGDRFAQASVEHARILVRQGDLAGAKVAVDSALAPGVVPDHAGAKAFRAELDDPIRNNPGLTAEHARNVDAVRRLLYTAEGAYNLGDFNKSKSLYEEVLRIDPTNSAARRGMERVAAAKTGYYRSAQDHTRAEMLGQVGAAWELELPAAEIDSSLLGDGSGAEGSGFIPIANKLDRIIIPSIRLEQASLEEALDLLRVRALELDTIETDPARKGVNFAVDLGDPSSEAATRIRSSRFDLQISDVPLSQVLRYITDLTRTSFRTDDFAVIIRPQGFGNEEMISRTYKVPPGFIDELTSGTTGADGAADDPFAEPAGGGGLLARQMSAQEALSQTVPFPEGASATYNKTTNSLRVVNTITNQDTIARIIETITQAEPVMVVVRVTIIRTEQNNLKELGFDWLLDNFSFSGDQMLIGGGTRGNGGDLGDIVPVQGVSGNPVTAGNRSGTGAISSDSIDARIFENNTGAGEGSSRAPGIVGVNGLLDNSTIQALMRGLDQKKGTDIMSQPSVVTRNGQSSSIFLVREFIFPTEYEPPELPNSTDDGGLGGGGGSFPVTPATPTAFEKKDVGLTLEILPVADANKRFVEVTLNPTLTDFDGFVNYGSPINSTTQGVGPGGGLLTQQVEITRNAILMPVFSVQRATTSVTVADGATIAIAGLMRDSIEKVEDKTPILGDLPVVGRLFQSQAYRPVSTAVIFLVNVELVDPTGRRINEP